MTACDDCLRRADLIAAIAGHLQVEFKQRTAPGRVLALPDADLLALGASAAVGRRYSRFDAPAARAAASAAGLVTVCRCRDEFPGRLRDLADPPAVLHVLGDAAALRSDEGVAIVGARRASQYGLEVARGLGRGLAAAGVPVVSGLAMGIDSAAHAGALSAPGGGRGAGGGGSPPRPPRARCRRGGGGGRSGSSPGARTSRTPWAAGGSTPRWPSAARSSPRCHPPGRRTAGASSPATASSPG